MVNVADDDDDDDDDNCRFNITASTITNKTIKPKCVSPRLRQTTTITVVNTVPSKKSVSLYTSAQTKTYHVNRNKNNDNDSDDDEHDPTGSHQGCFASCGRTLARLWRQQVASLLYLRSEISRQPRSYALGWFVVFVVVVFIATLINAVGQSPLIFLRFSEIQIGESDLIAYPGAGVAESVVRFPKPTPLLDQNLFTRALGTDSVPGIRGSTGRWLLLGQIKREKNSSLSPLETANVVVLGINSTRETELELGRKWNRPPVPAGEIYLSRAIVKQLQLAGPPGVDPATAVGAQVILALDSMRLINQLSGSNSVDWENLTDDQSQNLLSRVLPTIDWAKVYSTPVFNNGIVPDGFSLSQTLGIEDAAGFTVT
mgnify:FL=1